MKAPILAACLGGSLLLGGASSQQLEPVEQKRSQCCPVEFTAKQVLIATRLPNPVKGLVQVLQVTQPRAVNLPYGMVSHAPYAAYSAICRQELANGSGVALIVQGQGGASISLWSPRDDRYEEQTVWGTDPLHLGGETRIVYIGRRFIMVNSKRTETLAAWVRATRAPDDVRAAELTREIRRRFGVQAVEVFFGVGPDFWDTAEFPIVVPALGMGGNSLACNGTQAQRMYCLDSGIGKVECELRHGDR